MFSSIKISVMSNNLIKNQMDELLLAEDDGKVQNGVIKVSMMFYPTVMSLH